MYKDSLTKCICIYNMTLNAHCTPCRKDAPPLSADEVAHYIAKVPDWTLVEGRAICRRFTFKNFREALVFVEEVSHIAETENHHPDICFGWGYAEMTLTTHAINGLHQNDFIIASKINALAA